MMAFAPSAGVISDEGAAGYDPATGSDSSDGSGGSDMRADYHLDLDDDSRMSCYSTGHRRVTSPVSPIRTVDGNTSHGAALSENGAVWEPNFNGGDVLESMMLGDLTPTTSSLDAAMRDAVDGVANVSIARWKGPPAEVCSERCTSHPVARVTVPSARTGGGRARRVIRKRRRRKPNPKPQVS